MAKVITTVLKFPADQTQKILEREDARPLVSCVSKVNLCKRDEVARRRSWKLSLGLPFSLCLFKITYLLLFFLFSGMSNSGSRFEFIAKREGKGVRPRIFSWLEFRITGLNIFVKAVVQQRKASSVTATILQINTEKVV